MPLVSFSPITSFLLCVRLDHSTCLLTDDDSVNNSSGVGSDGPSPKGGKRESACVFLQWALLRTMEQVVLLAGWL